MCFHDTTIRRRFSKRRGALFAAQHRSANRIARHTIFHFTVFIRDGADATRAVVICAHDTRTWCAFARRAAIGGRPNGCSLATSAFGSGRRLRFGCGLCGSAVPELRARAGQCSGSEKTAYDNSNYASHYIPSGFHGLICSTTITQHGRISLERPCASLGQTCAVFARTDGLPHGRHRQSVNTLSRATLDPPLRDSVDAGTTLAYRSSYQSRRVSGKCDWPCLSDLESNV